MNRYTKFLKKLYYLCISFCVCDVSYASGLMSLSAIDGPFYGVMIFSGLLSFFVTLSMYKKLKKRWLWLLFPVLFLLILTVITTIYFLTI